MAVVEGEKRKCFGRGAVRVLGQGKEELGLVRDHCRADSSPLDAAAGDSTGTHDPSHLAWPFQLE